MRILNFRIENFRNLRLAECNDVPNFMVICGGNGAGKSTVLEALMTAKEHAGAYGNFTFDPRAVSADAQKATVLMKLAFTDLERKFVESHFDTECPETDEVEIEITKGGAGRATKRSRPVQRLLSYYSRSLGSPGFFDYINAHRQIAKSNLESWSADFLSDERAKQTLAGGANKFQFTKQYLAGLKMGDLQEIQEATMRGDSITGIDSLKEIREFFNDFFAPMQFGDVYLNESPFLFAIDTPMGRIDIDDLSSGEKEILNVYIRFNQLSPNGAVILFDEADAHLHPDLERRYLELLRSMTEKNQLIITTHSPEMMIATGTESLYTVLKQPQGDGSNQFQRVSHDDHLHEILSELMGSRGIVSFNQRIVFIEGQEASADRAIYEGLFPPSEYNISFVPAGDSSTVNGVAEKVNHLLGASIGFQQYFSIVDGDSTERPPHPEAQSQIFQLPVYHVENFLLDDALILDVIRSMMGKKCPYSDVEEIEAALKEMVLSEAHVRSYAKAKLNARIAVTARNISDKVFQKASVPPEKWPTHEFADVENDAKLELVASLKNATWRSRCKGREVLKAFCSKNKLKYEHFRNLLIENLKRGNPPVELKKIIDQIMD